MAAIESESASGRVRAWRVASLSALALALVLPAAGCLDYDEVLTIAADGSGSMAIDLKLDLTFAAELKKLDPNPDGEDAGDVKTFVTKDQIQKDLDVKGITVKACDVEEKSPQKTHVTVKFDFANLEALRAVRSLADRDISVEEKGESFDFVYRFSAQSMLTLLHMDAAANEEPKDDKERKAKEILDDARKASTGRFTLKLPGNLAATNGEKVDDRSARWTIDKSRPKAQAVLLKEPLSMSVTLSKKDAPFWEKEKDRKKSEEAADAAAKSPKQPDKPKPPGGD